MKNQQKEGFRYEKEIAKKRGKHLGGPGRPDYVRGKMHGEVKATARPVDASTLEDLHKKGVREVDSKNGYTRQAKDLAKKNQITLRQKNKPVK